MKALLLAAGRGTRISRYLGGKPKCLVPIGDTSLIKYSVELLLSRGVTKIGVALGYQGHEIRGELKGYDVKFFNNPVYDVTNSIISMWFAKDFMNEDEDILIMNADVYMEEDTLDSIIESKLERVVFADSDRIIDADYKLKFIGSTLIDHGKHLEGDDISGEYIGVGRLSASCLPDFLTRLDGMVNTQQHSLWWENVLYNNNAEVPVSIEEITGKFWAEVDYIEDYSRILKRRGEDQLLNSLQI